MLLTVGTHEDNLVATQKSLSHFQRPLYIYVLTLLTIYIYMMSSSEDAFNEALERYFQSILIDDFQ